MRRVVITGVGAVTPLGNNMESTWINLTNGVSGISRITRFDTGGLRVSIAGELKGFVPENYLSRKDVRRLDPFVHYAAAAALMACEDAGFDAGTGLFSRAGVIIGSSRGGITTMEKALREHILQDKPFSAYLMSSSTINMASSLVSIKLGIRGPAIGVSTACASGATAIGEAFRMIRAGAVDMALAGGAEAPLCRLALGGYDASGALSRRNHEPAKASRPFDRDRDG
ncbi:MAG: beta-ketoacyl-[acyl-carrier-protein] synthase II, partial [Deferribacteres bacterium]|nr:beta-ketoacyl-[acyl-carrier-protein] synthase II [Deferribacteres bacterium]